MRREKKPCSGVIRFAPPISVAWYWEGSQIDGPGKVAWDLLLGPSWLMDGACKGTRPCLRKNAQAVALRAASARAEELGQRLFCAAIEMKLKAREVTP
jgi:hypothetical protein